MRTRPPYTPVKLYYDGRHVEAGDYMKTPAGTAYLIQSVRPSPSRPQRRYLGCLRWPADEIPAEATVHPLIWYARAKRKSKRLSEVRRCS